MVRKSTDSQRGTVPDYRKDPTRTLRPPDHNNDTTDQQTEGSVPENSPLPRWDRDEGGIRFTEWGRGSETPKGGKMRLCPVR